MHGRWNVSCWWQTSFRTVKYIFLGMDIWVTSLTAMDPEDRWMLCLLDFAAHVASAAHAASRIRAKSEFTGTCWLPCGVHSVVTGNTFSCLTGRAARKR